MSLAHAAPHVQIIHSRDPDAECALTVFVDGAQVTTFEVEDIDPGRGYTDEDWQERIDGVTGATPWDLAVRAELEAMQPAQREYAPRDGN